MGATAASPKRMKASALPDEMVEEILARLPAKSLRRFQCVSRSWHGLITSPRFRQLHSSRAGSRQPRALFVRPAGDGGSFHACREFPGGPVEQILSSDELAPGDVFPVSKPCHGLVLLCCLDYGAHYVWNPSTGDVLDLPDRTPSRTAAGRQHRFLSAYGLGHCAASGQYKLVRMYWHRDAAFFEVFTLDQSTYWRPAATEPPPPCRRRRPPYRGGQGAVFCNGSLHFVAEDGVITAFNVTDETFGTLVHPAGLGYSCFHLTELDGCLCAYFPSQLPTPAGPYRIWLLRDYDAAARGDFRGWEELRCFDWATMTDAEQAALKSQWVAPLAMMTTKIMFGTGSCKVFVVDPAAAASNGNLVTQLFSLELKDEDGGVVQQHHDGPFPTMGFFEESLVPVGRTIDEIILSSPSAEAWCGVLSRLPARTVGRLNQVCKDWRAIIKSDYFVLDSHLQYHQANLMRSPPQIMFTDGKPNGFKPLEDFIMDTSLVPPLIHDGGCLVCSKPCHGLNAGSFMSCDFVCNPITGYYKTLDLDDDDDGRPNSMTMFAGHLGLGYDVEIDVHVLVRFTFKDRNLTTRDYKLKCEIGRVDQDTCMFLWELEPPQRPIAADTPPAYSSGKIYWMTDTELLGQTSGSSSEIIALDVATLEFEILKGPPHSHHHDHGGGECVSIIELQGQICMVYSCPRFGSLEIWAMKGNGAWSMEYYIDLRRSAPEYSSELVMPIAIDPIQGMEEFCSAREGS